MSSLVALELTLGFVRALERSTQHRCLSSQHRGQLQVLVARSRLPGWLLMVLVLCTAKACAFLPRKEHSVRAHIPLAEVTTVLLCISCVKTDSMLAPASRMPVDCIS